LNLHSSALACGQKNPPAGFGHAGCLNAAIGIACQRIDVAAIGVRGRGTDDPGLFHLSVRTPDAHKEPPFIKGFVPHQDIAARNQPNGALLGCDQALVAHSARNQRHIAAKRRYLAQVQDKARAITGKNRIATA